LDKQPVQFWLVLLRLRIYKFRSPRLDDLAVLPGVAAAAGAKYRDFQHGFVCQGPREALQKMI